MPVWQQEDIQGAAADIDALTQKLREYSAADESEKPGILEDINEITAAMDEGAVTEYIALLMQVQSLLDSGMTEAEVQSLFPELDFSGAMDQIAAIQTFLTDRKNLLPGLESMFSEAIPDEVLKIATDLDMTGAQARWDEFAQNPGAITTEAIISGYGQQEGVEPPKLETVITISGYDLTAYRQFLADNPIEVEGVLRLSEVYQNPEDALKAENVTFWQNGVEIPASLVPKELLTPDKVAVLDEDDAELRRTAVDGLGFPCVDIRPAGVDTSDDLHGIGILRHNIVLLVILQNQILQCCTRGACRCP